MFEIVVHFNDYYSKNNLFSIKAVWCKESILTLLSLYEAHYPKKVTHKNNKTQLWTTISTALQSMGIKV